MYQFFSHFIENDRDVILFSVLLGVLLLLTVIMLRLGWFNEDSPDLMQQVPLAAMATVHNPFVLTLTKPSITSLEEGVSFTITSCVSCVLRLYWGTLIQDIYPILHQPWEHFHRTLLDDTLKDFCLQTEEIHFLEETSDKQVDVQLPDSAVISQLGSPPRPRYPLVVVICDNDVLQLPPDGHIENNRVVSMITLLHIKDSLCPGESHIFAQYIRTPHSRPHNLTKLFVTADEYNVIPDATQSHDEVSSQSENRTLCVICTASRVERAMLPCKHACACNACFSRLTHCPMCRAVIASSFSISDRTEWPS